MRVGVGVGVGIRVRVEATDHLGGDVLVVDVLLRLALSLPAHLLLPTHVGHEQLVLLLLVQLGARLGRG